MKQTNNPVLFALFCVVFQMEFDEREMRKEIGITIRNIHGIRCVQRELFSGLVLCVLVGVNVVIFFIARVCTNNNNNNDEEL